MFFFCKLFERRKRLIPQLREVIPQQRQPLGIQLVNPARTLPPVTHQSRLFQHPQVLRNGWPRHRQSRRQLVHRLRMVRQHLEDRQPGWVAQSRQSVLYVSFHLP